MICLISLHRNFHLVTFENEQNLNTLYFIWINKKDKTIKKYRMSMIEMVVHHFAMILL
jgi:hypothetical protein